MSTTTTRSTGGRRVTLPGVGREIEDVLLWRDVRISGAVFAAGSFLYFLLEWSGYSLLTLIANTLLLGLGLAFLWSNIARFTGRSGVSTPALQKPVNEADVKQLAQQLTVVFNKLLAYGNRLVSGQDVILTGQVGVVLYIISRVGRYFSSLGLLYTVFVLAFILPKVYEWKKDDIDSAVSQSYNQGTKLYHENVKPYVERIPRGSTSSRVSGATSSSTGPTAAGRTAGVTDSATSGPTGGGPTSGGQGFAEKFQSGGGGGGYNSGSADYDKPQGGNTFGGQQGGNDFGGQQGGNDFGRSAGGGGGDYARQTEQYGATGGNAGNTGFGPTSKNTDNTGYSTGGGERTRVNNDLDPSTYAPSNPTGNSSVPGLGGNSGQGTGGGGYLDSLCQGAGDLKNQAYEATGYNQRQ